jgi:asparagine synthase (glutamine-hydrolysing)
MCGIAGQISLKNNPIESLGNHLSTMSRLLSHRGPDGSGEWCHSKQHVGLSHSRLSIIDLSEDAAQPMTDRTGNWVVFNGEIYNYLELRVELGIDNFVSQSDTEVILFAYHKWGVDCVNHLKGMFAFALWDEAEQRLFCARDRFGIKPFYYTVIDDVFYFASEAKALMPFLPDIATDKHALAEYLTFQYTIGEQTLFKHVKQLLPAHHLIVSNGNLRIDRYWDVYFEIDFDHTASYFESHLRELLDDSIRMHLRSDVAVGSYVSGGIDSSLIHILAHEQHSENYLGFHGKFTDYPGYDESHYAYSAINKTGGDLNVINITSVDLENHFSDVIYHLDFPVAGPGSFSQFMVSKLASEHLKVVLGGQGGDEIFGGYARYVVAYFEQCIKAAIDGNYKDGNFVVTIESIVQNLDLLREYKPLIKEFWREGLFDPVDERYFRLVDRSTDMQDEIAWDELDKSQVFNNFQSIFNNLANVRKEAYFDKMTHYDFKSLLPALLHVEDRMSMAHGLESRVPLLDHKLVEFAATIPADIKFKSGNMKLLLKTAFSGKLPPEIVNRRDKMGFPVPLKEWFAGELRDYAHDILNDMASKNRPFINSNTVIKNFGKEASFSRKTWALMSLELWYQQFHDKAADWRSLAKTN